MVCKAIDKNVKELELQKTMQIVEVILLSSNQSITDVCYPVAQNLNSILRYCSILQNTLRIIRSKQINWIDRENIIKLWWWLTRHSYNSGQALSILYKIYYYSRFGILNQWDSFIGFDLCCNNISQKLTNPQVLNREYELVTFVNLRVENIKIEEWIPSCTKSRTILNYVMSITL